MDSINVRQIKSAADYYFEFKSAFAKYTFEDGVKVFASMAIIALTDYILITYFAADLSVLAEELINFIVENL
jgi:hypothetical protein